MNYAISIIIDAAGWIRVLAQLPDRSLFSKMLSDRKRKGRCDSFSLFLNISLGLTARTKRAAGLKSTTHIYIYMIPIFTDGLLATGSALVCVYRYAKNTSSPRENGVWVYMGPHIAAARWARVEADVI